jgi:hypothetical protein
MKLFCTVLLCVLAIAGYAQDSNSELYDLAVEKYQQGGNGYADSKYWTEADSLLTAAIENGASEAKYYHVRGLARKRAAENVFADSFYSKKDAEMVRMFEDAKADLQYALDNESGEPIKGWRQQVENEIVSLNGSLKQVSN